MQGNAGLRVGAVGSRGWTDKAAIARVLDDVHTRQHISLIVSGGAYGPDRIAAKWARDHGVELLVYEPDWKTAGRRAGAIRNQAIVDAVDYIIAFWDGSSPGTKITIDMARRARKPVRVELPA